MAKYLTLFQTKAEYDAAKSSLATPNVSYCEIDEIVAYMKDAPTPPPPHHDYSQDYFTIVPQDTGQIYIGSASYNISLEYSTDSGSTWTTIYSDGSQYVSAIDVTNGDKVLFKGTASASGGSGSGSGSGSGAPTVAYPSGIFTTDVNYSIEGNIMSLVCGDDFLSKVDLTNFDGNGTSVKFENMFQYDTYLVSAENLSLPATTLTEGCYQYMFQYCSSLTTAPELPATTLTEDCYYEMFQYCTSLTTAPELPATTLTDFCYRGMFNGCTSLTTAPELPATTLASSCYLSMFLGCTSLTTAPELPATTLANNCYGHMFNGCTSLNYIKCLATNISASYCTNGWVDNVAATGTFVKDPNMSSWTTGSNGIPSGWTVEDAS